MGENKKRIHNAMILKISEMIPSKGDDFDNLKMLAGGFNDGALSDAKLAQIRKPIELLLECEKRGVIGIGKYDNLKDMLKKISLKKALEAVEEAEMKMAQLYTNPLGIREPDSVYPVPSTSSGTSAAAYTAASPTPVSSVRPNITKSPGTLHVYTDSPRASPGVERRTNGNTDIPDKLLRYEEPKGIVLVINNFTEERAGTLNDAQKITSFFQKELKFKVIEKQDQSYTGMLKTLEKVKNILEMFEDYNMLIVFILSHGDKDGIKTCKTPKEPEERRITENEIVDMFKADQCKEMAGKPKLFFMQCCRGDDDMAGIDRADSNPMQDEMSNNVPSPYKMSVPTDADILISHATTPGYRSFRRDSGSWYIQTLMKVFFQHYKKLSLHQMLTITSNLISDREACGQDIQVNRAKQVPSFISTLRKELYFT